MEMMKQIALCLWISMTFHSFAVSNAEIPKECVPGTPDYNEKLCTLQEAHSSQPSSNSTQSQPKQEVPGEVTVPGVDTATQEAAKNVGVTTPEFIDLESSGSSLRFSLFSVLCLMIFFSSFNIFF